MILISSIAIYCPSKFRGLLSGLASSIDATIKVVRRALRAANHPIGTILLISKLSSRFYKSSSAVPIPPHGHVSKHGHVIGGLPLPSSSPHFRHLCSRRAESGCALRKTNHSRTQSISGNTHRCLIIINYYLRRDP